MIGKPLRMRKRWLWLAAAVAIAAALTAMYAYQKSLEEDLEAMLRAALQQFRADSVDADTDKGESDPEPDRP